MANKEIRQLLKRLEKQGWRIVRNGGKHFKAYSPNPAHEMLTISNSPSDKNAIKQILRQLKKMGVTV